MSPVSFEPARVEARRSAVIASRAIGRNPSEKAGWRRGIADASTSGMQIEMVAGWIGNGLGYVMLALALVTCACLIALGSVVIVRSMQPSRPRHAKPLRRSKPWPAFSAT